VRSGTIVQSDSDLTDYEPKNDSDPISFECDDWTWRPPRAHKVAEESRHLSRLDLLKELFNIFLNRAVSTSSNGGLRY
jgi:hypothetical protein